MGSLPQKNLKKNWKFWNKRSLSGVGAHHQNGVAERAIATIIGRARAMILHAAIHWPGETHTDLWPLAIDYAVYLWNHTPHMESGMSPIELFCRLKQDCGVLRNAKVWGCPTYVLDPKLQDGKKLPKWQPHSRRGQFLGFSLDHASNVGLIRNLRTGFISPQFHVVHDENFETVSRGTTDTIDLNLWVELVQDHRVFYPDDEDAAFIPPLLDDWLDEQELIQRHDTIPPPTPGVPAAGGDGAQDFNVFDDDVDDDDNSEHNNGDDATAIEDIAQTEGANAEPTNTATEGAEEIFPGLDQAAAAPPIEQTTVRRNPMRQACGANRDPDFIYYNVSMNDQFLLYHCDFAMLQHAMTSTTRYLHFMSIVSMDHDKDEINYEHPLAFAMKASDADSPTWDEAMRSDECEDFWKAMDLEIEQLQNRNAWTIVDREEATKAGEKVIGSTWAFRRKRYPDGRVKKLKARICARGDQQVKGIDVFDTFSPVVSWSTVRLMLILSVALNLVTVQVDYDNAFVQAELKEPVYMETPRGYRVQGKILHLNKSLYGL